MTGVMGGSCGEPQNRSDSYAEIRGNAPDAVKAQATATTDSYNDEGFAKAVERFVLGLPE